MIKISGHITTEHYKTILTNGRHELTGDEPKGSGGSDLGFSPSELLCSALATCTCVTLRMFADRKEWSLEKVEVHVEMERDASKNITTIKRRIQLFGNLSTEEKKHLLEIAEHCPIHKILTNPIQINTALI
jgi:putative redox protein